MAIENYIPLNSLYYEYFDGQQTEDIGSWYYENLNNIYPHVFARITSARESVPAKVDEAAPYLHNYCPSSDYQLAIQMVNGEVKRRSRFLPAIIAVSLVHGCSCHKLMFGPAVRCIISRRLELFLSLLNSYNILAQKIFLQSLKDRIQPIYDVEYILSLRLMELADEIGVSYEKLVWDTVKDTNSYIRSTVSTFLTGQQLVLQPVHEGMKFNNLNSLKDYSLIITAYTICSKYHVSADRLLLRDYSTDACWSSGAPLSRQEQEYASLFLLSDIDAQTDVINQLLTFAC